MPNYSPISHALSLLTAAAALSAVLVTPTLRVAAQPASAAVVNQSRIDHALRRDSRSPLKIRPPQFGVSETTASIQIRKQADQTMVLPGASVRVTTTIDNVSDQSLQVAITDTHCAAETAGGVRTIQPGQSYIYTCNIAVAADLLNKTTASVAAPAGQSTSATGDIHLYALDHLIGGGAPETCTRTGLDAELANAASGVTLSFRCGLQPFALNLSIPLTLTRDVTLDGDHTAITLTTYAQSRCLDVPAGVAVTLRHLTFQGCASYQTYPGEPEGGGAIRNAGAVAVDDSLFLENDADLGGAIYNAAGAVLLISNSRFDRNESVQFGGALYNALSSTTYLTRSEFTLNNNAITNLGMLQITGTQILMNFGRDHGAGIHTTGVLTVIHSSLISNTGAASSAGIWNGGRAFVQDSAIDGNHAERMGGGIINDGALTLDSSTVNSNTVSGHFSGFGGGLINNGEAHIINSTISSNHNFVATSAYGGGGILTTGHLTVTASTLTGNSPFGIDTAFLAANPVATATVKQLVLAMNTADFHGGLQSLGYNVIGIAPPDSVMMPSTGDQIGTALAPIDPRLGPLANNGGKTQTQALQPGSPALDLIPPSSCAVAVDQRGVARPQGFACDAGAFEANSSSGLGPLLDTFDRPDGPLLGAWVGDEGLGGYHIIGQRVDVLGGGPIYWNNARAGQTQQAWITLAEIDPKLHEHALLLKVQGDPPDWRRGYIQVTYFGLLRLAQVSTYQPGHRWVDYLPVPMLMKANDRLGAQVLADGRVKVFKNEQLAFTAKLIPRDKAFFEPLGGRIGLWFNGYGAPMHARFDNFGGGNVTSAAVALDASDVDSSATLPETGKADAAVITAYTERDHLRDGSVFSPPFTQLYLPVLLAAD